MSDTSPGRQLALPGLLVGAGGMFAVLYSTQAILPELSRSFSVSPATAGLTVSVVVLALAIGAWGWGPLSDRWGPRATLVRASALIVIPTVLASFSPTFAVLLVCRALQGLCMPGLLVVGAMYVVEVFGPSHGSRAMGLYTAALVAGGIVARVGVGLVTAAIGWRWALGGLAIFPAAGALVMARTLPEAPHRPTSAGRIRGLLTLLGNRQLRQAAIAGSALFFAFVAVFSFATFRLERAPFHWSPGATSLVFLLWGMGALGPAAGTLIDRIGWRTVALTMVGVAAGAIALTLVSSPFTLIPALAVLAGAMFCGVTATQVGTATATARDRGLAGSLYYSAYYGSGAIAAFVPGLLWESQGWGGVVALALVILAAAGVALAGAGRRAAPDPG